MKNATLADGDLPGPRSRIIAEQQVVRSADRLIANTVHEAVELRDLYGAEPVRTDVVRPGVDLRVFRPADGRSAARTRLGLPPDAFIPLFVGRIQPLKAPDVLLRAVAELLAQAPSMRGRLLVPVVGGLSGPSDGGPRSLRQLASELGILDVIRFEPALPQGQLAHWYRAANILVVPSRSESFGLVALEAQACGTPVLAAEVGGLPTAVWDGVTGLLVPGHEPADYARKLLWAATRPELADPMGQAATRHAQGMSWQAVANGTLRVYASARRSMQAHASGWGRDGGTPLPRRPYTSWRTGAAHTQSSVYLGDPKV